MYTKNILELADKIKTFKDMYESDTTKLWATHPDGDVDGDTLLEFILENDYVFEHAIEIKKLQSKLK